MTRVLAALSNRVSGPAVLDGATALASLFGAELDAIHVREGSDDPRLLSEIPGLELRLLDGPVAETLIAGAADDDVVAFVVGARDIVSGSSMPGHITAQTIVAIGKPMLVVPPDAPRPARLDKVVVPLDGTLQTADALSPAIDFACAHGLDVRLVHVHDESCLPPFEDQPQHESAAWRDEFLRRYCPCAPGDEPLPLTVRAGVPGEEILAVAEGEGADLIMLAWNRDLSEGRAAVIRGLLERSSVPLLLYPVTS